MKPRTIATVVWCGLGAVGALSGIARPALAQQATTELLADTSLARRTLAARAAALSGTPVRLDTLVHRALREAIDVRRSEALVTLRRGIEQEARGVFDPTARLSSLAASAPSVAAVTQQRLELGAGWTAPTGLQVDVGAVRADQGSQIDPVTGTRVVARPTAWTLALSQPLLEGRGQPGIEPRAAAAERRASAAALERSR